MSNQPPKDFLALSHGHEWVNFYESFDKLVQDHLSRSSELLRKAMSLPEVADREVAQVRTELEGQLTQTRTELEGQLSQTRTELEGQMAAERQQHQAALTSLRAEISSSHQQAASLARMFGSLLTDLDRLSTTVESALSTQPETIISTPPAESYMATDVAEANESGGESSEEPTAEASAESTEWLAEMVAAESGESGSSENEAMSDESQSEIDLNALAAAESTDSGETSDIETYVNAAKEGEAAEASASADESEPAFPPQSEPERPRPHWLSVARSNSSH
jgi:hypothetical protein